ncbi:MAG: threonylcarbamoyl-AMP synthase [Prevotellaceae bacterium]|jgi:tRNA threonylcarbamoyl adenosine modification protein (Sua5/YciO/YrdC/YwlC family)|nr:threonylcarbamoyl-AMP synthase [Prevotellaceae bacterium]
MLLPIHPDNPNAREVAQAAEALRNHGVLICPTDTVYAFVCALTSKKGYEALLRIKGQKEKEAHHSLLLPDMSTLASYAKVDNATFRVLKQNLPGPFTFILNASGHVPDKLLGRRKSIGIRVPRSRIVAALIAQLGCPLLTSSVKSAAGEYFTDPSELHERLAKLVYAVIDGGPGGTTPSTIVDCTTLPFELVREGQGVLI